MPAGLTSKRLLCAAAAVVIAAAAALFVSVGHHSASASDSAARGGPGAKYGGIPRWLPRAKVPVGRVLTATPSKPVLAIQGDAVSVRLDHGRVLATAVGPEVPEEGEFPVPATSPCTFVLTFSGASGSVPLSPGSFTVVDDLGHVHHPQVTSISGGAPPRLVPAGGSVSLKIHDVLPTGNGGLSWAPSGAGPIVSWDFDVEID